MMSQSRFHVNIIQSRFHLNSTPFKYKNRLYTYSIIYTAYIFKTFQWFSDLDSYLYRFSMFSLENNRTFSYKAEGIFSSTLTKKEIHK